METGDRYEPYRLVDADGAAVAPVAVFFQELLAAGKAAATVRSCGMDLLRRWRFLQAVEVSWERATRVDARDFSCGIQLTVNPRATTAKRRPARSVGAPNPVTGKMPPGLGYAPSTVAHSETVLRRFYDLHRDAGTRIRLVRESTREQKSNLLSNGILRAVPDLRIRAMATSSGVASASPLRTGRVPLVLEQHADAVTVGVEPSRLYEIPSCRTTPFTLRRRRADIQVPDQLPATRLRPRHRHHRRLITSVPHTTPESPS
ncbi:hypothetical protein [Streptomyces bicolor]|uniref:hypothetical protein n=1 Tax=Streptomyces bicolor TaxID=66874 RepID=UPI000690E172|nr:hypothetical protein [Streptomyces bicolor]